MNLPVMALHAWKDAMFVRYKDPEEYRRTWSGRIISKDLYGEEDPMGWRVVDGKVHAFVE